MSDDQDAKLMAAKAAREARMAKAEAEQKKLLESIHAERRERDAAAAAALEAEKEREAARLVEPTLPSPLSRNAGRRPHRGNPASNRQAGRT